MRAVKPITDWKAYWKERRYVRTLNRGKEINGMYTEELRLRLPPAIRAKLDSMAYPDPLAGWLRDKIITEIVKED